jgi:hypothetical protein
MRHTQIIRAPRWVAAAGHGHSPNALLLFAFARAQELRLLADRCTPQACRANTPRARERHPLRSTLKGSKT